MDKRKYQKNTELYVLQARYGKGWTNLRESERWRTVRTAFDVEFKKNPRREYQIVRYLSDEKGRLHKNIAPVEYWLAEGQYD